MRLIQLPAFGLLLSILLNPAIADVIPQPVSVAPQSARMLLPTPVNLAPVDADRKVPEAWDTLCACGGAVAVAWLPGLGGN